MAILTQTNTNTGGLSLKVLLISTAVFSLGVILKIYVPVVMEIWGTSVLVLFSLMAHSSLSLRASQLYHHHHCCVV
ncbi:hypothetical protein GIB67_027421 [Kingdonia uniflora]|uniref:Uncharacterized protein n=1 Tax=Kingdonia uniflora TaxID=39325 RepID=A0A7J7MFL6_9MAGN|nr:hypothetical protein GIB67_027421 [Kingdonia uniflora]